MTERRLSGTIALSLAAFLCLPNAAWTQTAPPCDSIDVRKCRIELSTGIAMSYLEAGPATGEAVILLHGLTDSSRTWSRVIPALRARNTGLHLFALDQRGHGDTSMPRGRECPAAPERCFRMADFADDVVAFMGAKGIRKATLIGHSMGSFVAQELALTHPELVERIVLVASSFKVAGNAVGDFVLKEAVEGAWKPALEAKHYNYPAGVYDLAPRDADANVEDWLAKNWDTDPVADPALLKAIVPETAGVKLGTWIGATKALLATDNGERLRSLTVPALVLWGAQDNTFGDDPDQSGLRAALDAAAASGSTSYFWKQYGVIPLPRSGEQENDIGHAVPWDAPKETAADIASFMATGAPTPDLYRTDAPNNIGRILTEPGKARIVRR